MKIMKNAMFGLAILACGLTAANQESIWEWKSGPHSPGFQLMEKLDYSRFYPDAQREGENARLIRLHIWYPAKESQNVSWQHLSLMRHSLQANAKSFFYQEEKPRTRRQMEYRKYILLL